MALKFVFTGERGAFTAAMRELIKPIADAATGAIRDVAAEVKAEARANIAAAGFSVKWQNALRVNAYPRGGKTSVNAATFVWHKIVYAGIFEEGGTIAGKPLLWLPFGNVPQKIGRKRMTPKLFEASVGDLFSIKGASMPLLGARVRVSSRSRAKKISLAALRRGAAAGRGLLQTVPIFFGVPRVTEPDKFSIREIVARAAARLSALYVKNLRV